MFKLILSGTLILGIIARIFQLTSGVDYDEAYSYLIYMSQPFFTVISKYNIPNNHILNSVMGWFTREYWGSSPMHLRAIPLLLGVGSFPVIWLALRDFFGKQAALLAACATFLSWPMVYYSAQARGYIYQIFFVYLSIALFQLYQHSRFAKRSIFILSCLCAALALWAIPTSTFPLFFFFVFYFFSNRQNWRLYLLWGGVIGFLTFILYLPAIFYVLIFGMITFPQKSSFTVEQFQTQLAFFIDSFFGLPWWALVVLLIPFFISLILHSDKKLQRTFFVCFLTTFILILAAKPDTINYDRLWLWCIPILCVFVFSGVLNLCVKIHLSKYWATVSVVFLVILSYGSFQKMHFKPFSKDHHSESLYLDLKKNLMPGDFYTTQQGLGTELDYWARVYGDAEPMTRFFMSGDWNYSLYRLPAENSILKNRIGTSSFYIVETTPEDLITGDKLIQSFIPSAQTAKQELSHSSKRAKLWKVTAAQ